MSNETKISVCHMITCKCNKRFTSFSSWMGHKLIFKRANLGDKHQKVSHIVAIKTIDDEYLHQFK